VIAGVWNPASKRSVSFGRDRVAPGPLATGKTVDVAVHVNMNGDRSRLVDATIQYPADKLTLVSTSPGRRWAAQTAHSSPGQVHLLASAATPAAGDQVIAHLSMRATSVGSATVGFVGGARVIAAATATNQLRGTSGTTVAISPSAPSGTGTLSLEPATFTATKGTDFFVDLALNMSGDRADSATADLTFPTTVSFVRAESTSGQWTVSSLDSQPGHAQLGLRSTTPAEGVQIPVRLVFHADSSGAAAIAFTNLSTVSGVSSPLDTLSAASGGSYTVAAPMPLSWSTKLYLTRRQPHRRERTSQCRSGSHRTGTQ
jgi:Cohesin domain